MLEDLLELGFSKQQIARLLGVSRWTIYRRVREYGLYHVSAFSDLSDAELLTISHKPSLLNPSQRLVTQLDCGMSQINISCSNSSENLGILPFCKTDNVLAKYFSIICLRHNLKNSILGPPAS